MIRRVPNSSLRQNEPNTTPIDQSNFCPIPQNTNQPSSELDILIAQYKKLVTELKQVRGKLYSRGVDPEKHV